MVSSLNSIWSNCANSKLKSPSLKLNKVDVYAELYTGLFACISAVQVNALLLASYLVTVILKLQTIRSFFWNLRCVH